MAGIAERMKMNKTDINQIYGFSHAQVEGFDSLAELALDMRWSWNHAADEVWRKLDPAMWELIPGAQS